MLSGSDKNWTLDVAPTVTVWAIAALLPDVANVSDPPSERLTTSTDISVNASLNWRRFSSSAVQP